LIAFRELMLTWPNAPQQWGEVSLQSSTLDVEQALGLEASMVRFYCQTFWNFVGRLPITPHRIPVWDSAAIATPASRSDTLPDPGA
jgi:hypothetical protein